MDDQRFDSVSRLIAQGASRRAVIRGVFAGGLTVITAGALSASAKQEKVTMCKPVGAGYRLAEINATQYEKRLAMGYFDPFDCGDGPTCEACQGSCIEYQEPCANDADCCSLNCLNSGFCGDLCYCHDRFDPDEQAAVGPMCGGSTGGLCTGGAGCLSSADCAMNGDSYTECVVADPDCVTSGGMCAYPLFPCEV